MNFPFFMGIGDWGLGVGGWGWGVGPKAQLQNHHSPIPNPHDNKSNTKKLINNKIEKNIYILII